jgi:hypothetical protein
MSEEENLNNKSVEASVLNELLDAMLEAFDTIREMPCTACGDEGYILPCIVCDKLVCIEHSDGAGRCEKHSPYQGSV